MKPTKPTRGRPSGEPTKQIRVYTADVPMLCRTGETQAEAVRRLVEWASTFPELESVEYALTLHGYQKRWEMRFPSINAALKWSKKSKFPVTASELRAVTKSTPSTYPRIDPQPTTKKP
jgi:hypothetical protein